MSDCARSIAPHGTLRIGWVSVVSILVVLILGGCAQPRDAMPVGGTLGALGPDQVFIDAVSHGELPPGWMVSGDMPPDALSIRQVERFRALGVKAGATPFALIRRTNASMLATPFLNWAWHAQPTRAGAHPVRIMVGLVDRGSKPQRPWWHVGGGDFSDVSRIIQVVWNETALGRGSVVGPIRKDGHPETVRYIARGGPEQANRWWVDAVDLSLIHRQVWPEDDPSKIEIRFIGVAVQATRTPATMNVAAVRLSR